MDSGKRRVEEHVDRALKNARSVWEHVLCVRRGETALTVCDPGAEEVGRTFHRAARQLEAEAAWLVMPSISTETGEPIETAGAALRAADCYIGISSEGAKSLTHTRARRNASKAGARGLTLPGFTVDMLLRESVCADYRVIAEATQRLAARLCGVSEIHLVSEGGTDLRVDVHGGEWFAERGLCDEAGQFSNLPGGEVSIAPVDSNGVLVIDGSMSWVGMLDAPLRITIVENRIERIEGDAAERLSAALTPFGSPAFAVAEIGIGMNPDAALSGNILEDEKMLGTVHIGFGDNSNMGGVSLARIVEAPIHGDGVIISSPRLYGDGHLIEPREAFEN
jgi:leucyl aminopeptidase (aminopeptidase T)